MRAAILRTRTECVSEIALFNACVTLSGTGEWNALAYDPVVEAFGTVLLTELPSHTIVVKDERLRTRNFNTLNDDVLVHEKILV